MSQNNPFRPYANQKDEASGPDAPTRRIDPAENRKSVSQNEDWRGMVGGTDGTGSFRATRTTRTTRPVDSKAAKQQERFLTWVTNGGWKVLAALGVIVIVLLLFFLVNTMNGRKDTAKNTPVPNPNPGLNTSGQPTSAIVVRTPPVATAPNIQIPTPPPAAQGQVLAVTGTATEGLFLRDVPGGTIVKTMPEGTQVEKLGEQTDASGILWYNIREISTGITGWSSAQFLVPVQ